jgi:hypothetical protein
VAAFHRWYVAVRGWILSLLEVAGEKSSYLAVPYYKLKLVSQG